MQIPTKRLGQGADIGLARGGNGEPRNHRARVRPIVHWRLGRSGTDLAKYAKGAAFKGGKDFTGKSGEEVKKYVEGILK